MTYETVQTKLIRIPFQGFYETIHDDVFERYLEYEAEHIAEENGLEDYEVADVLYDNTDWKLVRNAYAKQYADDFLNEISENIPIFKVILQSPREYNFSTDTITVEIPMENWKEMVRLVPMDQAQKYATEWLEPRSGFIPHYPQDMNQWGPIESWDPALTEVVVRALFEDITGVDCDEFQEDYAGRQCPFETVESFVDWSKVDTILGV